MKPEDIPQDVWTEADGKALDYLNWLGIGNSEDHQYVLAQTIARAIDAAKAAEREACLQACLDEINSAKQAKCFQEAMGAHWSAVAIRKRGKVNTAHKINLEA